MGAASRTSLQLTKKQHPQSPNFEQEVVANWVQFGTYCYIVGWLFSVFFFFSAFCCSLVRWRERCDITKTWLVTSSTFKSWSIFYQLLLHYCCVAPTVSQTNHIFIWLWIMTHCNNLAAIKVTHFNYKCFLFFFKLSQHDTDICSHSHRRVYMATLMSGWQETTSHDARYFMGMCIRGPVGIIWKKQYS